MDWLVGWLVGCVKHIIERVEGGGGGGGEEEEEAPRNAICACTRYLYFLAPP